ncbi:Vacuolar protein sorting-associated protein 52 A [Sesamum angolense]|uniref:Vacuolar protein sorting-associated protein 52 A n=1 Tax=Sesamum angolense TaxID=2727404 RepID=A0AAE2C0L9_9LAMI|nr:Vacuolar protein sorting-associated protein 52 A [Sesamum angolense]
MTYQIAGLHKDVENNLRQIELDSIEDYIKESDNLVSLHDQIHDCDTILTQMEKLLSGFQAEIGSISSDIKVLQEKSMDMGLKLKNRKAAESKLAKFVEDIIIPPRMIDIIVDGEVNEEYMSTLEILSKKLKYVETDTMVKTSKALNDVQPELEKLRQKAVSKVFDFIVQKLNALRKPKTNVQILQQSVLLKYKYVILFLKEHGKEVYLEIRAAYIDTMNKKVAMWLLNACVACYPNSMRIDFEVQEHSEDLLTDSAKPYDARFLVKIRAYIQALEKLQLDIATSSDLIGIDTRSTSLFLRGREPLKNRSSVFALGERINILKEIDESALIPHIAEANSKKYPYEVLFRSLHKLLMDTAASEYLFCDEFFGEQSMFYDIFAGPFSVVDEHLNTILPNCFDAIGLMLMIRIIYQHQLIMSRRRIPCLDSYLDKVNISLWPRFKMVFDMHLNSLRNANVRTLWEDDVHPHYVMRRYAEFTASLIQLNVDYGDGQLELNMERLRMAIDDLLVKLAKLFQKPKLQTEAGSEGGKIQMYFEELLKSNTAIYVEELLAEHFSDLIKFVKTRASEDPSSSSERPITVTEVEPIVKDFASRWKAAIELMHNDVITSFSNFLCGMEILRAALTQLLLYYTRLSDCMKRIAGGSALNKDLVSISSIICLTGFKLGCEQVLKVGHVCSRAHDSHSMRRNTAAYQFSLHRKDIARLPSDIRVWCSFHIGSGKPSTVNPSYTSTHFLVVPVQLFEGKKAELLEANLCIKRHVDWDSGSRWIWKKVHVQNTK